MTAANVSSDFLFIDGKPIFENLITKKKLCQTLSLSLSFLNKLLANDDLTHYKIGTAVRFRLSDVVSFLERRKRP